MAIRGPPTKIVDLRKAPADIVKAARDNAALGSALRKLAQSPKKLTQFLKMNILKMG